MDIFIEEELKKENCFIIIILYWLKKKWLAI